MGIFLFGGKDRVETCWWFLCEKFQGVPIGFDFCWEMGSANGNRMKTKVLRRNQNSAGAVISGHTGQVGKNSCDSLQSAGLAVSLADSLVGYSEMELVAIGDNTKILCQAADFMYFRTLAGVISQCSKETISGTWSPA
jgi:hypothetical protein